MYKMSYVIVLLALHHNHKVPSQNSPTYSTYSNWWARRYWLYCHDQLKVQMALRLLNISCKGLCTFSVLPPHRAANMRIALLKPWAVGFSHMKENLLPLSWAGAPSYPPTHQIGRMSRRGGVLQATLINVKEGAIS